MNKYTLTFLFLLFTGVLIARTSDCRNLYRHSSFNSFYKFNDTSKALKIGDKVPDLQLNNIINYPHTSAKISDFNGKVLILDFWATWCAPCLASMPKLDSLQKQFSGKVQVLQVAYQPEKVIKDFFEKADRQGTRIPKLSGVVNDHILIDLFPHTSLPHIVIINGNGVVSAITEDSKVNAVAIEELLTTNHLALPEKVDEILQKYDNRLPLFVNSNANAGNSLIYHSMLSGYVPGLEAGSTQYPLDSVHGLKITLRNIPLLWLFKTAYQERKVYYGKSRTIILVKDTTRLINNSVGEEYTNWLKAGNGFCYELVVPPSLSGKAYALMQKDLTLFFSDYKIEIQKRPKVCWVLIQTKGKSQLTTSGGTPSSSYSFTGFKMHNVGLKNFIDHLNAIYMQDSPYPVLNETNLKKPLDLDVDANLHDINSLNHGLAPYGLQFIKASRSIDVLVISDNPTH